MISLLKKVIRNNNQAVVLMYHRIDNIKQDPWDLCVSREYFEDQVKVLKSYFDVIPMYRLAERLRLGERLRDMVSITFDDGYLDNHENAKPILERHHIPATFYLTTNFKTGRKFWWDELEQIILNAPVLPDTAKISLPGKTITMLLGDSRELSESVKSQNESWRYGKPLENSRLKLYFECWEVIKTLSIEEQRNALTEIKKWAGTTVAATPPLMSEQHIRALSSHRLFEVGAHSVNHPALGSLTSNAQREEIAGSKTELENIVAETLVGFAYPYGHYNEQTPLLTKNSGFSYAVTTEEKTVLEGQSVFEIPRFQVKNITGEQLLQSIRTWKKASS